MAKKNNKKRMGASLQSPFSKKDLKKFVAKIPAKSKIQIVSVGNYDEKQEDKVFLEALWWEKR